MISAYFTYDLGVLLLHLFFDLGVSFICLRRFVCLISRILHLISGRCSIYIYDLGVFYVCSRGIALMFSAYMALMTSGFVHMISAIHAYDLGVMPVTFS